MNSPRLVRRAALTAADTLPAHLHPVLRRVYAARGLTASELALDLAQLLPPMQLRGIDAAASLVADAITAQAPICIAGDYDSVARNR